MKIILIFYLLINLSIIINSCSESYKEEYSSKVSIVLAEVTAVPSQTKDPTPDYTFSSTIEGVNSYGGSCSSSTTSAISGNNTITLASLSDGTYSDCTITVTNQKLDLKSSLTITSFTVDTTAPTIEEVTAVTTPTHDFTPDYTFSSTEAGTITYGGSCSSSDTSATTDNNTITLASLSERTYSDCTITVTDSAGNISNSLTITSFIVDGQMGGSKQGKELSLTATKVVSTFVGSTRIINCAALYKFGYPFDITTDGTNLYVVDTNCHTIKQIVIDNGTVTILAGTVGSSGSANGVGTSAEFQRPYGITTDGTNLYVADTNSHTIRKIGIDNRSVTTLAGTVGSSGSANGVGTLASFNFPKGITTDGTNLYVADSDNNLIRQIVISTKAVTTLAGDGSQGSTDHATGTSASFNDPTGITTDGTNLYVADRDNHLIRQIVISTKAVTTLAGTGTGGNTNGEGSGAGSVAEFNEPVGITTDGIDLYVIEVSNHRLRKID